jgi:N-acetylglucosamine-6-phosphate deacetylase
VKALLASRVFDGLRMLGPSAVLVEDGRVVDVVGQGSIGEGVLTERLAEDHLLAPGFVDLQVNGGGGLMFNDHPDCRTLQVIADAHARLGTTTILPTLISSDRPTRSAAIAAAKQALQRGIRGIAGLHLEGPFLSPARRGIHPAAAIVAPGADDIAELVAGFEGALLVTLAPEIVSAQDVAAIAGSGKFVFAGHTDTDFETARAGFEAGIVGTTHLFNAMSQLGSRSPGMVGAALLQGVAGIIVDLLHVHPASVMMAYRCMGAARLFLVSDAMATIGSACETFVIDGNTIRLIDGRLSDAAGTLAGAHLSMADAVRLAVTKVGIPLEDALRMATRTPADAVGLGDRGRIEPGSRADFVALDAEPAVRQVWRDGSLFERSAQHA